MMQILLDYRIDKRIENYFKSLNYEIIKIEKQSNIYAEISGHPDVFACRVKDKIILSENLTNIINLENMMLGSKVEGKYPNTAKYNVCFIDNYAIHNFKNTEPLLFDLIRKNNFELIDITQSYARCSILGLKNKSCITTDQGVYKTLIKNGFDVLFVEEDNIKLLDDKEETSKMKGFIGGCTAVIDNKVVIYGELSKFKNSEVIREFIVSKGYEIIEFKGMDITDYGSYIILN